MKKKQEFGRITLPKGTTINERTKAKSILADIPFPASLVLGLEDAKLDILDNALTAAEEKLRALLGPIEPGTISLMFQEHVRIHLATELGNIQEHGHRNDDPKDVPEDGGFEDVEDAGDGAPDAGKVAEPWGYT